MMLSLYLKHHTIKVHWWQEVAFHGFFTPALDGSQWSASSPGQLTQNIMYNDDVSTGNVQMQKEGLQLIIHMLKAHLFGF